MVRRGNEPLQTYGKNSKVDPIIKTARGLN